MHSPRLNWLLAQLPENDYDQLASQLELVGLSTGKQLFYTGQTETDFYFPTTCTVSAQIELENGNSTDIYLLGERGLFGSGIKHRGSFFKAIVRKPGFAYRCPAKTFMRELLRSEGLMMLSLLAMRIIMEEMATNVSCRTFHTMGQQVARWLLTYGQGEPVDKIEITHAELANALGARRERVTLALNEAARQGCIGLNRGHITVLDYPLLEKLACNCNSEPILNRAWTNEDLSGIDHLPRMLKHLSV